MGDSLAWVTLATNDSYSLGALVLAHSLKQVGTKQQLAVLITPGVTGAMRSKLQEVFNLVQEVNLLDSRDEANLRLLKRPELGVTFTKLHCWRLTQFNKCVFLDADTLVLENCDELFEREELSAAPDIGWPDCFNSGVFVYRPSNETYEKLIQLALEKGSFDGGDQGLLNLYFSDWAHKDISKHLPFIYNMASTACYSYLPAFKQFGQNAKIIHFIGSAKPWLQYFDTETKQVHPAQDIQHLKEILQRWWDIFCACIHPNLSSEMSVRSHTDTVHGSQPHIPNNSHPNPFHHYYNSQFFPNPSAPNPAVNYQNVWDPWEEYDSKQLQQKSTEFVDTYHFHEHSEKPFDQYSYETPKTDIYLNRSEQIEQHEPPQSYHHNTEIRSNDNCNPPSHNYNPPSYDHNPPSYDHNNFGHNPNHPSHLDPPSTNPTQDVHSNYQKNELFHTETNKETVESHIQNWENQLLESHNTTAYSDADKSNANVPPHTPINSQPQPVVHNDTPKNPPHEISQLSTQSPTIPGFRLPNESITTTVSDEITLQTDSNEDSRDNAGIAGAFAKLTLGTPRTAEQLALDDHLRRQGWEVGNIDYLGRDSFENIWSKICETLSSGPEPPQSTAKEPPPSKITPEKEPAKEGQSAKKTEKQSKIRK